MSKIVINKAQFGTSGTAANNFVIKQSDTPDGKLRIQNGNEGSATDVAVVDSAGNWGIGITPSAWGAGFKAINLGGYGAFACDAVSDGSLSIANNAYANTTTAWKYTSPLSSGAGLYSMVGATHKWYTAPSGTVGNPITFTQAMTLDASGTLTVATGSLATGSGSGPAQFNNYKTGNLELVNRVAGNGINFYVGAASLAGSFDSSGTLFLATTETASTPTTGFKFYASYDSASASATVTGHISGTLSGAKYANYCYNGASIGSITQNGTTAVAYNTTSDHRLKENVRPANAARFNDIEFVDFEWVDGRHDCGVIAHQLQSVYPDLVLGEKDAVDEEGNPVYQQVNYIGLIARMGSRIQQLESRLYALENK